MKRQGGFRPILKPPQNPTFYFKKETAFRFRGGLALSYRWFVLRVGFGRSDWQWPRVNKVGPRSVLVSGHLFGGGFNRARKD